MVDCWFASNLGDYRFGQPGMCFVVLMMEGEASCMRPIEYALRSEHVRFEWNRFRCWSEVIPEVFEFNYRIYVLNSGPA